MYPSRFIILILIGLTTFLLSAGDGLPPFPASPETQAELAIALDNRLQIKSGISSLTLDLFNPVLDTAMLSPDGTVAVLWLALLDDSQNTLATEPGLALAIQSEEGWKVMLPGDSGWEKTLASLPEGMLPLEQSPAPQSISLNRITSSDSLTGYYLPYAAGTSRWLEGSISHFQSIPELGYPSCLETYCRYAYDFTDDFHFPLVASKKGNVVASRDSCTNGDPGCTNYIVLYNAGDQAYQIYLHLANGTIPNKLTPGTKVEKGQFIGDSDDTGYSTSQHVHFMVTDSIWLGGDGYYWGRSVDIRFSDVVINNGIPRRCYEIVHFKIYDNATECLGETKNLLDPANDWFISGNVGAYPPTGTITQPVDGAVVADGNISIMDVTALAKDDVQVTGVQLVANLDGQWVEIGPKNSKPNTLDQYVWEIDLCADAPVNGPLQLALRVWDHEGNVAQALDPRAIQVDHACPPPTSQLNPAEVFDSTAVRLSWDAANKGAGIDTFDLQWRADSDPWIEANTISIPGNRRSFWFSGQAGVDYAFRLRAQDTNNQLELWPIGEESETIATLPIACTKDIFEPDDNFTLARMLNIGEWTTGNLCDAQNPDWFRLQINKTGYYFVEASSILGGAAVRMTIYKEDGETILIAGHADEVGEDLTVHFKAAIEGSYYLKLEPLTPFLMGTDALYGLSVSEGIKLFIPFLGH